LHTWHTWIFQANPERYNIFSPLANNKPITRWAIERHKDDVERGDRAVLWVGGKNAPGIYAIGSVTGLPVEAVVDDPGWLRHEDHGVLKWFCPVEFDTVLDPPIDRSDLKADPRFERSRILNQPFAANPFLVSDEEWSAISDRLE
jgi:EVE domain